MSPTKCPNCRLSLPQSWTGMNDANAKCPYCGKSLAGKAVGSTQSGQSVTSAPPSDPPAAPPPPRQGGGAKTILWGVGGAPIPGVPGKPAADQGSGPVARPGTSPSVIRSAEQAPVVRPAVALASEGISTAATVNRNVADVAKFGGNTQGSAAPTSDGAGLDVDISESFDAPAAKPASTGKPAATVMFDESSPMAALLAAKSAAAASNPSAESEDQEESSDDEESSSRPAKSKTKGKPVARKGQRRPPSPAKWGSAGGDEEQEAQTTPSSSRTGLIIAAVGGVVIVLAGVAFFALRGGKKSEGSTVDPPKLAEPAPGKAEPSAQPTHDEPPALAAKPTPEPPKPATPERPAATPKAAAEKPSPAEKPSRPERAAADKPAREEKPAAEKARPVAGEATLPPSEPKSGGKMSEADYQKANEAYQHGNEKLFKGNTAEAISEFNQALKLNPKDPAIHRGLGLAYAQSGNSAEAVKHLKAYLKAAPKANDRAMVEKRIDQLQSK